MLLEQSHWNRKGPSFSVLECCGSWQLPWFLQCRVVSGTWPSEAFSAPWTSLTSSHRWFWSRVLPVSAFCRVWQPAASFSDFILDTSPWMAFLNTLGPRGYIPASSVGMAPSNFFLYHLVSHSCDLTNNTWILARHGIWGSFLVTISVLGIVVAANICYLYIFLVYFLGANLSLL